MSKTYKHQSTYNYTHGNGMVNGKFLYGIKSYINRCIFSRWNYSRTKWYKHKNRSGY